MDPATGRTEARASRRWCSVTRVEWDIMDSDRRQRRNRAQGDQPDARDSVLGARGSAEEWPPAVRSHELDADNDGGLRDDPSGLEWLLQQFRSVELQADEAEPESLDHTIRDANGKPLAFFDARADKLTQSDKLAILKSVTHTLGLTFTIPESVRDTIADTQSYQFPEPQPKPHAKRVANTYIHFDDLNRPYAVGYEFSDGTGAVNFNAFGAAGNGSQ